MHGVLFGLSYVYEKAGYMDAAIHIYDLLAGLKPDNYMVYKERALLKQRMGDTDGAEEDFKKAMDNVVLLRYDFTNPDTKESKEAALKFRLVGVPFAAVIDEDQNIVKTFTGGVSLEELNEALKK